MLQIRAELKLRGSREALTVFYDHKDPQVRFQAAMATLLVLPERAREVLQRISDRNEYPQAMDARGAMRMLDDGTFKPS